MNGRPLRLGHRGARATKSIPENTIESFDQALADGCDGFEFDVRLTADRRAVIHHDEISRDPKRGRIQIALARGEELAELPQLRDVFECYHQNAFLDIELKVSGLEGTTAELLRKYPPGRGFVVSSFLPDVLQAVHAEDSSIPLGLICETKAELNRWRELPVAYVIPHWRLLGQELIHELRNAGKKIFVWTVNQEVKMRQFAEWGVDGIISDDTKRLAQTLIQ
jgi:glycerophosphoryl diester phosphodiesterase